MDLNIFKENIANQFLEEDQEKVSVDGRFRDIESYDSLTGMSILAIVKDEYNVDIPVEEYRALNSVNELYEYVKNKKVD